MVGEGVGDVRADEEDAEGGEGRKLVEEFLEKGEKGAFVRWRGVDDMEDEGSSGGDIEPGKGGEDGEDWREGFGKDTVDLCGGGSRGGEVRGEEVGFPGRWERCRRG